MAVIMKIVLNVAEKPSVAREIAKFLGGSNIEKRFGASKFNPIFEFQYTLMQEQVLMRVTSVQGHFMTTSFIYPYTVWAMVPASALFSATVKKIISPDRTELVKNLYECSKNIDLLALWLDCDREGENIAYEVMYVVDKATKLPSSSIKRAQFSALTFEDLNFAAQNLREPDQKLSDAVEARQELDLRLGAAFTRFQTEQFQRTVPQLDQILLSYGPCQFPTLGFVVDRFLEIENFVVEPFWTIDVKGKKGSHEIEFVWNRKRLYDGEISALLFESCGQSQLKIMEVHKSEKRKQRPLPLTTIAFQKLAASKLKLDSDKAMAIAEKLYNEGYISYPRTETDSFKSTINLLQFIDLQTTNPQWSKFARNIIEEGLPIPRNGSNDDNSHPPIYPIKAATQFSLLANEWMVYELITRHFLACCSKDAIGQETSVVATLGGEQFTAKGLSIDQMNFMEIYPYVKWSEANLPSLQEGEIIEITECKLNKRSTQPPTLLTESDLISLMDKFGIGTDATIHLHIKTIQQRMYAHKTSTGLLQPTQLGIALIEAYRSIGIDLSNPELRAKTERAMNQVAKGTKQKLEMVDEVLVEMKDIFKRAFTQIPAMAQKIKERLDKGHADLTSTQHTVESSPSSRVKPPAQRALKEKQVKGASAKRKSKVD